MAPGVVTGFRSADLSKRLLGCFMRCPHTLCKVAVDASQMPALHCAWVCRLSYSRSAEKRKLLVTCTATQLHINWQSQGHFSFFLPMHQHTPQRGHCSLWGVPQLKRDWTDTNSGNLNPLQRNIVNSSAFSCFGKQIQPNQFEKRFQCEHPDRYLYLEDNISI